MEQNPFRTYHLVHLLAGNEQEVLDNKEGIEVPKEALHATVLGGNEAAVLKGMHSHASPVI